MSPAISERGDEVFTPKNSIARVSDYDLERGDYDSLHLILRWRNPRRGHLNLFVPSPWLERQTHSLIRPYY
jgi:hypothetical protein